MTAPAPAMGYPPYYGNPYAPPAGGPGAYNNLPMMMQSLAIAGNPQGPPVYPQAYNSYNPGFPQAQRHQPQDSQARVIQSRRQVENEGMSLLDCSMIEPHADLL